MLETFQADLSFNMFLAVYSLSNTDDQISFGYVFTAVLAWRIALSNKGRVIIGFVF